MKEERSNISKNKPFKVPDGYFKKVKSEVIDKLETSGRKQVETTSFIGRYWLPLAASLLIIFGVSFAIWQSTSPVSVKLSDSTEIFYPKSTDDLLAFVSDDVILAEDETDEIEEFETFLLALEPDME